MNAKVTDFECFPRHLKVVFQLQIAFFGLVKWEKVAQKWFWLFSLSNYL